MLIGDIITTLHILTECVCVCVCFISVRYDVIKYV